MAAPSPVSGSSGDIPAESAEIVLRFSNMRGDVTAAAVPIEPGGTKIDIEKAKAALGKAAAPPGAVPIHPFVIVLFKCGSGSDGEFDPSDVEHVGPEEDLLDADTIRPCQAVHFYWGMKDEAVYTGVGEWAYCDKFFDLPVGELEGWYYYNIDKHKRDDFDDITCGLFTAALEKYGGDAESVECEERFALFFGRYLSDFMEASPRNTVEHFFSPGGIIPLLALVGLAEAIESHGSDVGLEQLCDFYEDFYAGAVAAEDLALGSPPAFSHFFLALLYAIEEVSEAEGGLVDFILDDDETLANYEDGNIIVLPWKAGLVFIQMAKQAAALRARVAELEKEVAGDKGDGGDVVDDFGFGAGLSGGGSAGQPLKRARESSS